MPAHKCVLVTVGTTKFDDLIRGVDSVDVVWALKLKGYDKLVVQHGNGVYKIQHIFPCHVQGFEVEYAPMLNIVLETCPWRQRILSRRNQAQTLFPSDSADRRRHHASFILQTVCCSK